MLSAGDVGHPAEWETYGKVLQVIGKRRSFLKNVVEGLPKWIGPTAGVIGAIAFVSAEVLNKTLRSAIPAIIVTTLSFAMLVMIAAIAVVDFGPFNRVHLVRSHERSKVSRAARRKYAAAAFTFVLGVLFTKFVDWIFSHWLK